MTDDELLARLGHGLTPDHDALVWNVVAARIAGRLVPQITDHTDLAAQAALMIANARELVGAPDAYTQYAMLAATLHTVVRMMPSPTAELLCRLFEWGTRRLSGDRRIRDSLAGLAAEARELAVTERAAQLADARALLG